MHLQYHGDLKGLLLLTIRDAGIKVVYSVDCMIIVNIWCGSKRDHKESIHIYNGISRDLAERVSSDNYLESYGMQKYTCIITIKEI